MEINDNKDEVIEKVNFLYEKYQGNPFIQTKIHNYIVNLLPINLENQNEEHVIRKERKEKLTEETDKFIARFMAKNKYFYCNLSEYFFSYDGKHYKIHNEDDIVHEILSTITQEKLLMSWKQKIKNRIICTIRDKSLFYSIPESYTIQSVINYLYPKYFKSKNTAKYFLTIIGDNLLKKNDHLIYLITHKSKILFKEIKNQGFSLLGYGNIISNLKFKYYEHNFNDCRLINTNPCNNADLKLDNINFLDFFCVSAHYSNRYKSSDDFLRKCYETSISNYALYLKNNSQEKIVDNFIETSIQNMDSSNFLSINMKNMLFLWKKYLNEKNIPNIIFTNPLKEILRKKLNYDEETELFTNITSIHIPIVANFLKFWEETIKEEDGDIEFEVEEICLLFKSWSISSSQSINDKLIIDLLQHFYPEIVIEENKYILNINCKLWDKHVDILDSLNQFKMECISNHDINSKSLYEAYTFYSKLRSKNDFIVSKRYFEKYCLEYLNEYIEDNVISYTWLE
jgi:hypothetical protein